MKNDLISRQAAIRWVKTECNPYGKPTLDFESGKKVIEHLEQMPSADRPTGKWVGIKEYCDHLNEEAAKKGKSTRYMPSGMHIGVYCDQCWKVNEKSAAYCPNCGADMRGEEE